MAAKPKATSKKKAAPRKKAATKRAAVKKAAPAKRTPAIKQKMTKTAIIGSIAESTELSKKQVDSVLEELEPLIERHIKKGACGEFALEEAHGPQPGNRRRNCHRAEAGDNSRPCNSAQAPERNGRLSHRAQRSTRIPIADRSALQRPVTCR